MIRTLVPSLAVILLFPQEPEPVGKALDAGVLADVFGVQSALMLQDGAKWRFSLKLQAKKDIDTADVYCQVGFFDKTKHLIFATPLQFAAGIGLKAGESINASFVYEGPPVEEGVPWKTIAIRPGKKPN